MFAHATNVHAGIITSSPLLIFKARRIAIAALVQEFVRKENFLLNFFLKYFRLLHILVQMLNKNS